MGRTSDADKRLLDAALELIWEESYGGISIDDICNRANVKKGSFYYFFKSKAELAVAAMENLWEHEWKPNMDAMFSSSLDPMARLQNYLTKVYEMQAACAKEHGRVLGCPFFSVGSEVSTQEVDVNAKVREIFLRKRRYYESTIRDAVAEGLIEPCNPTEKAAAIAAMIEGLTTEARIMNDCEVVKNLVVMGMSLFTRKATPAPVTV